MAVGNPSVLAVTFTSVRTKRPDPADLAAFGSAARLLLGDQDRAARMGQAAQVYVRENFLGMCTCCAMAGCSAR